MQELLKRMKPEIEKATKATVEMIEKITQDTVSIKLRVKRVLYPRHSNVMSSLVRKM